MASVTNEISASIAYLIRVICEERKDFDKKFPGIAEKPDGYRTEHVDLMLWQYCMGLLHLTDASLLPTHQTLLLLNSLAAARRNALNDSFGVAPSFTVQFDLQGEKIVVAKTLIQR